VGETTHIGNEVKLYQGVTLGALSARRNAPPPEPNSDRSPESFAKDRIKRHPTIEDRVTIYAGATILGGDTVVGAGSIVGGNVWLVKSVPPESKIFGRPRLEVTENDT
jgi:serine O-acetyltransferase